MYQVTLQVLIENLSGLPPLELTAVNLLHTLRPQTGEWFPTSLKPDEKTQVVAATIELVSYTRRCAEMGRLLAQLPPIPLREVSLVEFSL